MTSQSAVDNFLSREKIAVFGVSRNGKKFGNSIFKDLKSKGYQVFAINPAFQENETAEHYPSLTALPEKVKAIVTVVPPAQTGQIVEEAIKYGIEAVWMQQGSVSEKAVELCRNEGIQVIHGECILMFTQPVTSVHKFHRWIWKILGKLPKN